MSTENHTSCCSHSPFIPLLLVAVSFLIVMVSQLNSLSSQRSGLQNVIQNQEQAVQQSRQVQVGLEKLVNDLLEIAQAGDADAKAIVAKYGIARQGGAAPAATPAPAAK